MTSYPLLRSLRRIALLLVLLTLYACRTPSALPPTPKPAQDASPTLDQKARAVGKLGFNTFVRAVLEHPVAAAEHGVAFVAFSMETLLLERLDLGAVPTEAVPPLAPSPPMDREGWEKTLDELTHTTPIPARLRFLIDGKRFFPVFLDGVEKAQKSVDIRVYIFDTDDFSIKVADLLRRRSRAVSVRVLFDQLGTYGASFKKKAVPHGFTEAPDMEDYLTADGSRVRAKALTDPWLAASHTKVMILDGRRAFLGGMNIGQEYRYEWHDMMVEATGPLAAVLQEDFDAFWEYNRFAGGVRSLFRKTPPPVDLTPPEGSIPVRVLKTMTWNHQIERAQLAAIRRARSSIWIENAYFGDNSIVRALAEARKRGVDVRVIVPQKNDTPVMQRGVRIAAAYLLQRGVRVYRYPGMTHVKAAIYDGWVALGSANFDKLSMKMNRELDIAFSDPATVERLREELFRKDFAAAREWRKPPEVSWTDYISALLTDQL